MTVNSTQTPGRLNSEARLAVKEKTALLRGGAAEIILEKVLADIASEDAVGKRISVADIFPLADAEILKTLNESVEQALEDQAIEDSTLDADDNVDAAGEGCEDEYFVKKHNDPSHSVSNLKKLAADKLQETTNQQRPSTGQFDPVEIAS